MAKYLLNYNRDLLKHYVRFYGWLKPFKTMVNFIDGEIKKGHRIDKCKYLTFCAVQAVDVFMFENLKFIYRNSESRRLENVYFCENDEESFTTIQKLIGSAEQGFYGDLKEIINQDENIATPKTSDPFPEPESLKDREKLRLVNLKKEMKSRFPFDVINLDFYGNFFPSGEDRYSDSMRCYQNILDLQKIENGHKCKRFTMFLTVYTPAINERRFIRPDVMLSFEKVLLENLVHQGFSDALNSKYGHVKTKELETHIKFILGFTKQVLFKETYKMGWQPVIHNILTYNRTHSDGKPHKETTFVVEFIRNEKLDKVKELDGNIPTMVENDYKKQLFKIVTDKPEQVPNESSIPKEVSQNLESTIKFRNEFLKEIGLYSSEKFD